MTITVEPGETLVFFTDGLVERRGEAFDTGLERLVVSAGRASAQTLEDLADSLIADALGGELPNDDVALVAASARGVS